MQRSSISDDDLLKLFDIYRDFASRLPEGSYTRDSAETVISQMSANPLEHLRKLNIDLPSEQIRDIYNKTGIIMLRAPQKEKVLLGCGNGDKPEIAGAVAYTDDPTEHNHPDYDTLNCEISMNPTIIADLELHGPNIKSALEVFGHSYSTFANEAATLGDQSPEEREDTFCFMQEGFKIESVEGTKATVHETIEDAGVYWGDFGQTNDEDEFSKDGFDNMPYWPIDEEYRHLHDGNITENSLSACIDIGRHALQGAGLDEGQVNTVISIVQNNTLETIDDVIESNGAIRPLANLDDSQRETTVNFLKQAYNIKELTGKNNLEMNPLDNGPSM